MSYNNSSFNKQRNYINDEIEHDNPYNGNRNIKSKYAKFNNSFNNATEYQPELQSNNHHRFDQANSLKHNDKRRTNHQNGINHNNSNNTFSNNLYKNNTNTELDINTELEDNNSFARITLVLGLLLVTIIFIISVVCQKNSNNINQKKTKVVETTEQSIFDENTQVVDITTTDTPLSLGNDTGNVMLDGSQEDVEETIDNTVATQKPTAKPTNKPTTKQTKKPATTQAPTTRPAQTPTQTTNPVIDTSLQTINETQVPYTLNIAQTGVFYPKIKGTCNAISEGVLRYYDSASGQNVDKYWRIQLDEQGNGTTGIMLTSGVTQYQLIILKTTLIGTANATISSSLDSYEIR